jgi:uncharacterized protein
MNRVGAVGAFIARWDAGSEADRPASGVALPGRPDPEAPAPMLTRAHPAFVAAVEPGVRALVLLAVDELGWISYSSCEGHELAGGRIAPRRLGILPRSFAQLQEVEAIAHEAAAAVNRGDGAARVRVCEVPLESGDRWPLPAVDIVFAPLASAGPAAYFRDLPAASAALAAALRRAVAPVAP